MINNKSILTTLVLLLCCGMLSPAPAPAAEANRGNAVPSAFLPEELKDTAVKDHFLPATGKQAGTITSMKGHVVVLHKDTGEAYFAAEGDTVFNQDVFFTLRGSLCRLKFFNADVISMAENTK